ncbi:hypothetical protein N658DRAFT_500372 [Parathielavia hyrcaniae]|uniref:Uncharacterized protein n=1 Tax=Parathielavia hyrcaniae TaxID=113614 RepID=A0AAN6SYG3_9PEZI|nr:hypothetical protein N658DRAFT_500372 [Parathielavia hyrcaniae]
MGCEQKGDARSSRGNSELESHRVSQAVKEEKMALISDHLVSFGLEAADEWQARSTPSSATAKPKHSRGLRYVIQEPCMVRLARREGPMRLTTWGCSTIISGKEAVDEQMLDPKPGYSVHHILSGRQRPLKFESCQTQPDLSGLRGRSGNL